MIANYTTVTVSGGANENLIPAIAAELQSQGFGMRPNFYLDFIGFETTAGTTFKINGRALKVPTSGKFFSPYRTSSDHMKIESIEFDSAVSNMDFWVIY